MALVPTLGCSGPLHPSLLLLAFILSGNIIPGYVFLLQKNGPYIRTRLVTHQEKNKHTGSTTPTDSFAPASTSGHPRGRRAQAGLPLSEPVPTHPCRNPGPKRPRMARPQTPHLSDPHVYCCYYCGMLLLLLLLCLLLRLIAVAATTAAVLLLRLVE